MLTVTDVFQLLFFLVVPYPMLCLQFRATIQKSVKVILKRLKICNNPRSINAKKKKYCIFALSLSSAEALAEADG